MTARPPARDPGPGAVEGGPPIVLVVGPTAGGKTELAVALARGLPGPGGLGGECISADSMQVYRGMDLGTAKPTAEERSGVPHHGIDLVEPDADGFTVDHWLKMAESVIGEIAARGRAPIVVGGTNLYVQAFMEGLMDGPPPDPALRERLEARPPQDLHRELAAADPEAAARIHPNDRKRLTRALEIRAATGRDLAELQTHWVEPAPRPNVLVIGLEWPTEVINRRINARVRAMVEAGLIEEVRALHAAGRLGRQAREALGYKQIVEALEGRRSMEEAIEQIKIRTRRFAKQQRTWLRRFRTWPSAVWIDAGATPPGAIVERALAAARRWIGRGPG